MSTSGPPPITSETPSNAFLYEQVCLVPLPPNTTLDYRVRVDDETVDFYFHYDSLPGASASSRFWVCRTVVTADSIDNQTAQPGEQLYDVEQIDTSQYDAQASAICTQSNPGFFSKLACGTATFGDLPQAAKWLIYGTAGLVGLIALVYILSASRAVGLA